MIYGFSGQRLPGWEDKIIFSGRNREAFYFFSSADGSFYAEIKMILYIIIYEQYQKTHIFFTIKCYKSML